MDDVIPFLENVLRGRNVPRERMLSVAEHYYLFGGCSPINEQNRKLISALEKELETNGPRLPVYWGNRNWHPLLADTLRKMQDDGIKHAVAFVTSAYSSYSSCRQYLENIAAARDAAGSDAPRVDKIRAFYNHPDFIRANAESVSNALAQIPGPRRAAAQLVFTAHSIPISMARNSRYEAQLKEAAALVATAAGHPKWTLAYQSRSGSATQAWLGPDILECLQEMHESGSKDVVVSPLGFVSDHMEVVYDLDVQARKLANQIGINLVRAATAGTHQAFVQMIRNLIVEKIEGTEPDNSCGVSCCFQ
jgi:ferrochelatase